LPASHYRGLNSIQGNSVQDLSGQGAIGTGLSPTSYVFPCELSLHQC